MLVLLFTNILASVSAVGITHNSILERYRNYIRATSLCNFYVIYVKMKNQRFYNFMAVIYPDDPNYKMQLDALCQYDYIYINHDKDLKEDNTELKKLHTHIIVKFKNARTISAIAKECYLKENMIEPIKKMSASLKYLIHYKNDDKVQYDIENVVSNCDLLNKLKAMVLDDTPESEKALTLGSYIIEYPGILPFEQFFFYVCKSNQYSVYRRDASTFKYLLERHNEQMRKDGYID